MRILTIFTRYGTDKYASAERELDALFDTQLPAAERDVVIVDTALAPGFVEQAGRRTLLGSDNDAWEFSAIDTAVRFLGHRLWAYDLVNVTTSAFRQLYVGYLERFTPAVLQAIEGRPVCLGHIDCYNEPIRVREYVSQHWIRTSCFFLPPRELGILQSVRSAGGRDRWFSGDPAQPFRDDAPLSSGYRRLIVDWLTGGDTGQGVTWHSPIALDAGRLGHFEQKALAILNEQLLAIRLRAAGCRLVDVTWLSTRVGEGRGRLDWDTPWWRQIAERHADAVHVTPGGDSAGRTSSPARESPQEPVLPHSPDRRTALPQVHFAALLRSLHADKADVRTGERLRPRERTGEVDLPTSGRAVVSFSEAVGALAERGYTTVVGPVDITNPGTVSKIRRQGAASGVVFTEHAIDRKRFQAYLADAGYRVQYADYYGGNQVEKSLEHFIALELLQVSRGDVFIDIAAEQSPFAEIVARLKGATTFSQDIMYPDGVIGNRIGGDACAMPVPDGFASKACLTCSLQHFEGDADTRLFVELARVLRPGGAVCIVPFYVNTEAVTLTDPVVSVGVNVPFESGAPIHCVEGWGNRHGRFYSPESFARRIAGPLRDRFRFDFLCLTDAAAIDPTVYARFAFVATRLPFN